MVDITSGRPDIVLDADQWISQLRWFFLAFVILSTQQATNACVRRRVGASMVAGNPLDQQALVAFENQRPGPRVVEVASDPGDCWPRPVSRHSAAIVAGV